MQQVPSWSGAINAFKFAKYPIPILTKYARTYGETFKFRIGGLGPKAITTIEPEVTQYVLQKNHRNYLKSDIQLKQLGRFAGKGLLTTDGPYWLRQRRLIQPGFHRQRLANLVSLMSKVLERFEAVFEEEAEKGVSIDFMQRMMQVAFSLVTASLFDTKVSEEQLTELNQFINDLQSFIILVVRRPYLNWWYSLSGQMRKHDKIADDARQIVLGIINQRRESGVPKDDLLQMLLDARYEDTGEGMTDEQLMNETLILFVAGHETAANAMSWFWYLMDQHPDVAEKIRQELYTVLGDRSPGFEDLPKLVYLKQAIQETLRLYPPVWITDRVPIEEDKFHGYHFSKGTIIIPFIYGIHHNPRLWPDPERFDPDRFSPEKVKQQIPFAYLPFGGGPHLCIGNHFAMMEMQLIVASLIRKFRFRLRPGIEIRPQSLITLRPWPEMKMTVEKI